MLQLNIFVTNQVLGVSTAGYGVWGCVFTAGYGVVCSQLGVGLEVRLIINAPSQNVFIMIFYFVIKFLNHAYACV